MRRLKPWLLSLLVCLLATPIARGESAEPAELYPFMEQAELIAMMETGQRLEDRIAALYADYGDDLSETERFTAEAWMRQVYQLAIWDDWAQLEKDLLAAHSAEAFGRVLAGRYIGINAAPDGAPQPMTLLEGARPMLDAAGYADWPLLVALHQKAYDETMPAALILVALDTPPDESGYRKAATFSLFADGRVNQIYGDNAGYAVLAEATQAQAALVTERALAFAQAHIPFAAPEQVEVAVSASIYDGAMSGPVLRAFAYDPTASGAEGPFGAAFEVSADSGRILWMMAQAPRELVAYAPTVLDDGSIDPDAPLVPIVWSDGWAPEA